MLFPLKFRATIQRKNAAQDRLGQEIVAGWVDAEEVNCLFLTTSGNKDQTVRKDYQGTVAFYVNATSDIQEGDRVINIRTKAGTIIEAGPFEVLSTKRVPNHISGGIHHISCKLKGYA
jgi:hypothetical protein